MPKKSELESCNPSTYRCIDGKSPKINNISKLCNENKTFHSRTLTLHERLAMQSLHILLVAFILLHTILLPAAASSLSVSAPPEVDISGEGAYEMNFICSNDANSLSALFQVPEGFSYTGNTKIILNGAQSSCEPSQSGQSLQWDLSSALKSCRHVMVNEWEQNPNGADTGMEWIELYNPTSQAVNIGGWKLVDSYYEKSVTIPQDRTILPGDYQLLTWTNGSLINSKTTCVFLLDSAGIEVDCTLAAKDEENDNRCCAHCPNGKDMDNDLDWKFQEATPGGSNDASSADIYVGESLRLQFNLTSDCSAPSQA
jgi:hypothetical protein